MPNQTIEPSSLSSSQSPNWMGFGRSAPDWALFCGILGLSPLLWIQGISLWSRPHFQFFPLAFISFIAIIYLHGKLGTATAGFRRTLGMVLMGLAVVIAFGAAWLYSPWLAHASLIALCLGWMFLRLAGTVWHQPPAWILLLTIILPLPLNFDSKLVQKLQAVSSRSASSLLELASVPHLLEGNTIEVRSGKLFVDEACSGVDSLYAMLAIAVLVALWHGNGLLISACTIVTVPMWAWLGNTLRLFTIAYLLDVYQIDLLHGWKHTMLGLALFGISFGLFAVTAQALTQLFSPFPTPSVNPGSLHALFNQFVGWPLPQRTNASKGRKKETPIVVDQNASSVTVFRFGLILSLVFVSILGVTSLKTMGYGRSDGNSLATLPSIPPEKVVASFQETQLKEVLGEVAKFEIAHRETGSFFGEHSAVWIKKEGGRDITLSLDFPFVGFHSLEVCYTSTGNDLIEPVVERRFNDVDLVVNYARFTNSSGLNSFLYYVEFDQAGRLIANDAWARVSRTFSEPPVVFQLQLRIEGAQQLTAAEEENYVRLLSAAFETFKPIVSELGRR
jgi:exosortase